MYTYIYIYIERERYIYMYIYICISCICIYAYMYTCVLYRRSSLCCVLLFVLLFTVDHVLWFDLWLCVCYVVVQEVLAVYSALRIACLKNSCWGGEEVLAVEAISRKTMFLNFAKWRLVRNRLKRLLSYICIRIDGCSCVNTSEFPDIHWKSMVVLRDSRRCVYVGQWKFSQTATV